VGNYVAAANLRRGERRDVAGRRITVQNLAVEVSNANYMLA
jgi:hypothetical protein